MIYFTKLPVRQDITSRVGWIKNVELASTWKEAVLSQLICYIERCIEGLRNIRQDPSEDSLCSSRCFVTHFFRLHRAARFHHLLVRNVGFHLDVHMVSKSTLNTHPPRSPTATGVSKANKPTLRLPSLFSSSGKWTENYPLVCFILGNSPASEFCMRTFRNTLSPPSSFFIHTHQWRWNRPSVPKRRHTKFRRRGITQKKVYSIQNTAKFWKQELSSWL